MYSLPLRVWLWLGLLLPLSALAQPYQINFSDGTSPPTGWETDEGLPYGPRGNGLTYGWVDPADLTTPVDISVRGRNRNPNPDVDVLTETLMHMQYSDVNSSAQDGTWLFDLPNGFYEVEVTVGDNSNNDSYHIIRAEGIQIMDFNTFGGGQPRFATGGCLIEVTDSVLTIDALGGNNTKIVTIVITPRQPVNYRINFADAASSVYPGFLPDTGAPYGPQGGTDFGWVDPVSGAPVSMASAATNAAPSPDVNLIRETYVAMRPDDVPAQAGAQNGTWEIALPNGTYQVSLQAGNPVFETSIATTHALRVEGQTLLDFSVPVGALGVRNTTASVVVTDGRLTVDADNGVNTYLQALMIEEVCGVRTPLVLETTPTDGETNVFLNPTISANSIFLPNPGPTGATSLDNNSINNSTVRLFEVANPDAPNGASITATVNGTGGGDAINLSPIGFLNANTWYRLVIDGVTDLAGEALLPHTMHFRTGTQVNSGNNGGGSTLDLSQVSFQNAGVVKANEQYTTLTFGPDNKLYGLTIGGDIYRWDINVDGTLANEEVMTTWKTAYGGSRTAIGLVFDPAATASNLIAYVSHCSSGLNSAPAWDGRISRLTGADLEIEELLVTNLPRSIRDHLTNSMVFRPGEPTVIYFNQGSNSAGGRADGAWGNRPERLLSAACLRLDLSLLPTTLPLDVQTSMNPNVIDTVDVNSPTMSDGTYNPYYVDAPLTIYASGVRNAYDLVWHSNGQLYIPTNGTAGGSNSPASVDGMRRPDGTEYLYAAGFPQVPDVGPNNTQRDWLFRIDPSTPLGYYGHPNPLRGEYILNRGAVDVNTYGAGVGPDPNYRGAAFDFQFGISPNGVIEYRSLAHAGNLQGAMLVCRYSGGSDLITLVPDGPNGDISTSRIGIPGLTGLQDPLDVVEDTLTGNLYVSDFGRNEIVLLRPNLPAPVLSLTPEELIIDQAVGTSSASFPVTLVNKGRGTITGLTLGLGGPDAAEFAFTPSSLSSLPPDSPVVLNVTLTPTSAGPKIASLVVSASDPSVTPRSTTLRGLGTNGEPSLQWVLDAYLGTGLIEVGDDDPATAVIHSAPAQQTAEVLGDELGETLFRQADLNNPVSVELISVYGPTGSDPVVGLSWYEMNNPTANQEFFTLSNSPAPNGQSMNFSGGRTYTFNPSTPDFGFSTRWPDLSDRAVYLEDGLNTFAGSLPHHARIYPVPGQANTYVVAFEAEGSSPDFQDAVFLVRNVELSGGNMELGLSVTYPGTDQGFPWSDWMTFQRIDDPVRGGNTYNYKDTANLRLSNPGSRALIITELDIADTTLFDLPNGEDDALPLRIAPGASYNLLVRFIENTGSKGTRFSSLTVASNGGRETLTLAGAYQRRPEGGNELSFQNILDLFGFQTRIPASAPWPGDYPTAADLNDPSFPYGEDIVVSELWGQADGTQPIRGIFIYAQFAVGNFPIDVSFWDGSDNVVGGFDFRAATALANGEVQAQRLFPMTRTGGNTYDEFAQISLPAVSGDFRVRIGPRNTTGNGNITPSGFPRYLGARLFRVRDRNGDIIPGAYIGTFDLTPGNHDFNDGVVYFENIEPRSISSFPVELTQFDAVSRAGVVDLAWETQSEENTDRFFVQRSADGETFAPIGSTPAAGYSREARSYQLTDAQPLSGRSYYRLMTRDLDGSISYSQVVEVLRQGSGILGRVYPNPTAGQLMINLLPGVAVGSQLEVTCYNAVGQAVLKQQTIAPENATLTLDTSGLAEGMYVLRLTQADGRRSMASFVVRR
jgi:hypothetical protein